MNPLLESERRNPRFDARKITEILDGGLTRRRREIERAVRMDVTFDNGGNANLNRVERHVRALWKHLR